MLGHQAERIPARVGTGPALQGLPVTIIDLALDGPVAPEAYRVGRPVGHELLELARLLVPEARHGLEARCGPDIRAAHPGLVVQLEIQRARRIQQPEGGGVVARLKVQVLTLLIDHASRPDEGRRQPGIARLQVGERRLAALRQGALLDSGARTEAVVGFEPQLDGGPITRLGAVGALDPDLETAELRVRALLRARPAEPRRPGPRRAAGKRQGQRSQREQSIPHVEPLHSDGPRRR
ncbi:hypothetical protein D3C86_1296430 [compost metagenome]